MLPGMGRDMLYGLNGSQNSESGSPVPVVQKSGAIPPLAGNPGLDCAKHPVASSESSNMLEGVLESRWPSQKSVLDLLNPSQNTVWRR